MDSIGKWQPLFLFVGFKIMIATTPAITSLFLDEFRIEDRRKVGATVDARA
jgi:hypothetical protein